MWSYTSIVFNLSTADPIMHSDGQGSGGGVEREGEGGMSGGEKSKTERERESGGWR